LEFLILGIVPADGPHGLTEAANKGWNAIMPLKELLGSPIVFAIGKSFAFFTMTASYIALALAYLDFLADGLKVKKKGIKKVVLCLAVFVPPTIVALTYPHIFITALSYAGGFSCAILFGLFPPVMVWVGRYIKKEDRNPQMPGGKVFLASLVLLFWWSSPSRLLRNFKSPSFKEIRRSIHLLVEPGSIMTLLLLIACILGCAGNLFAEIDTSYRTTLPENVAEPVPWLTGPLLTPAGHTIPNGHANIEPYEFVSTNYGLYNSEWRSHSTPKFYTLQTLVQVQIGMPCNFDLRLSPSGLGTMFTAPLTGPWEI